MPLLASKPAAAILAATATAVPLLLVGANEAAGAAQVHISHAAHHATAARETKAKHRFGAAHHSARTRSRRRAGATQPAHRTRATDPTPAKKIDDPGRRANSTGPAHHATPSAGSPGKASPHAARSIKSGSWHLVFGGGRKAHAASDPADTISDFKFTPGTLTIHVGDTVTWTNNGPTEHTATADDGSFNTGTLKKGQSASHTFTKAGTFAYICAIHPFMKGTVVVEASAASTTSPSTTSPSTTPSGAGGNGSGTSGSTSTPSGSSSSTGANSGSAAGGRILPETGLDLTAGVLLGLALLGAGLGLRRRVS